MRVVPQGVWAATRLMLLGSWGLFAQDTPSLLPAPHLLRLLLGCGAWPMSPPLPYLYAAAAPACDALLICWLRLLDFTICCSWPLRPTPCPRPSLGFHMWKIFKHVCMA